jgi:hypothetical protein
MKQYRTEVRAHAARFGRNPDDIINEVCEGLVPATAAPRLGARGLHEDDRTRDPHRVLTSIHPVGTTRGW